MDNSRSGLTLLEVLVALAIFLIGSVGIVALFAAASVMHVDASNKRIASFIANDLLAEINTMRYRDIFAKTTLAADIDAFTATIPASRISASDGAEWAANFDRHPWNATLAPDPPPTVARNSGMLLLGRENVWYEGFALPNEFSPCTRAVTGFTDNHTSGTDILQPRTWYFVLDSDLDKYPSDIPLDATTISVFGNPTNLPAQGYIMLDEEWIRYSSHSWDGSRGHFNFDPAADRGYGRTEALHHLAGTPVTPVLGHTTYPGLYYTVQFYPTSSGAHVIVSVGYGKSERFRVHVFHTTYMPTIF